MLEPPERLRELEILMSRVTHDLYGNGQPGFIPDVLEFITRADERALNEEKQRNKRDQEIKDTLSAHNGRVSRRLGLGMLAIALMGLLLGWLTFRDSQRKVGEIIPPVVQSSQQPQVSGTGAPHY